MFAWSLTDCTTSSQLIIITSIIKTLPVLTCSHFGHFRVRLSTVISPMICKEARKYSPQHCSDAQFPATQLSPVQLGNVHHQSLPTSLSALEVEAHLWIILIPSLNTLVSARSRDVRPRCLALQEQKAQIPPGHRPAFPWMQTPFPQLRSQ